jgi:SAM-dependent methyltransferase
MTEITLLPAASYTAIASEYYDPERHPTCADFRSASDRLLNRLMSDSPTGWLCDVGAGDSALASWLTRHGQDVAGIHLFDASPEMLAHSARWIARGATAEVARADALPAPDRSVDLIVASLADPYDNASWWQEVSRILAPDGQLLLTAPSLAWASSFRTNAGEHADRARFVTRTGLCLDLPSYVRDADDERVLIEEVGLRVAQIASVSRAQLAGSVSPKLNHLAPEAPVFVGYRVIR